MARRLLAGLLTTVLAAALLVLGGAAPANAGMHACGVLPQGFALHTFYEPRMFHYALTANRNKNNVNIRIHNSVGVVIWSWNSPDNRDGKQWYHIQPGREVPPGGHVTFEAIFDVSLGSDPRCTYTTNFCCSTTDGWLPNGHDGPGMLWGESPPYLTALSDGRVGAELLGHTRFDFVVRSSGMSDTHFTNRTSPFVVSQHVYGGRTVQVTARLTGSESHPWTYPELSFVVPTPPPTPTPPCEPIPPAIICST